MNVCYGEEHLGNTCMVRNPINIPAQPYSNRLNRDLHIIRILCTSINQSNIYSIKSDVCVLCDPQLCKSTAPKILKLIEFNIRAHSIYFSTREC